MSSSLEAKIVVLGAQGVGKTSLVHRYVKNTFHPPPSTVGASFLTKRVLDSTSDTIVRLQLWDTAGQERFRSISRLYYRGANACLLCYDITDQRSFEEMWGWFAELRGVLPEGDGDGGGEGEGIVVHVVGTKSDVVAVDPGLREVPFERTIAHVAEVLHPSRASTPPPTAGTGTGIGSTLDIPPSSHSHPPHLSSSTLLSADSKRSSGFWGMDVGWDCCHEISAKDGEGIDEVFRVITRKLVEQRNRREAEGVLRQRERRAASGGGMAPGLGLDASGRAGGGGGAGGEGPGGSLGMAGERRSWLGLGLPVVDVEMEGERERRRCCQG